MNKLSMKLWTLLTMLSVLVVVGCNKEQQPEVPEGDSTINLKSQTVDVSANGGKYSVNYTITNPIDGENVTVVPAEDWITDIDVATPGVIKFSVARNSVEVAREATVDVSYKGATTQTFTVKQAAALAQDLSFEIEIAELGFFTVSFDIYPTSQDTAFLYNIYSPDEIKENGLESDDALFEYDMEYLQVLAYLNNISLQEVIEVRAKYGNQYDVVAEGFIPESTYYLVAYYCDVDTCERLSDIYRFEFTTPRNDLSEMEFTFDYSVDQNIVNATVTAPTSYLDAFYFDIMQKSIVDDESKQLGIDVPRYFELYNNTFVGQIVGSGEYSPAGYVDYFCSYISDDYTFECLSDTEYYLYAFAVTKEGICATVPCYTTVKTDPVAMSDNQIVILVNDITTKSAKIMWKTTNKDPYIGGYVTKEEWDSFGTTERAILNGLINTMGSAQTLNGDNTYYPGYNKDEAPVYFTPNTEYVAFAFGYKGGTVTTQLFSKEFATLEDRLSEMTLIVKDHGYFLIDAVKEVDPAIGGTYDDFGLKYISLFDVEYSDPSMLDSFYCVNYIENPYGEEGWNSPENVAKMVLHDGPKPPYGNVYFSTDGLESYFWAQALDKDGYYTAIYEKVFKPTPEGVNPDAQLFVDLYREQQEKSNTMQMSSVVYDSTPAAPAPSQATIVAPVKNDGKKQSLTTPAKAEKLAVDCLMAR